VQRVKEVDDALSELVFEVELLTLSYLLSARDQILSSVVNILQEILRCSFQKQNLIVVVPMMGKVATLFTDKLAVKLAVGNVAATVVGAQSLIAWGS